MFYVKELDFMVYILIKFYRYKFMLLLFDYLVCRKYVP